MGRAARARQSTRVVTLDGGDYWKLMKLNQDFELATQRARAIVAPALQARAAHLAALATKYPGFEPENAHYDANDATCTLTRKDPPTR